MLLMTWCSAKEGSLGQTVGMNDETDKRVPPYRTYTGEFRRDTPPQDRRCLSERRAAGPPSVGVAGQEPASQRVETDEPRHLQEAKEFYETLKFHEARGASWDRGCCENDDV